MRRAFLGLGLLVLPRRAAARAPPAQGGYYKDDGPHEQPARQPRARADAVPKSEPLHTFANRPYKVFGKAIRAARPRCSRFRQRGIASWYGKRFHGQKTSSGEIYDMYAMTAAHPTLPIPSYVRVTNTRTARASWCASTTAARSAGRVIDLSYVAANKLGYIQAGEATVEVESIVPGRSAGL